MHFFIIGCTSVYVFTLRTLENKIMFKLIVSFILLFPLTIFAQTVNLVGNWYAESTETNSSKKITSVLIKDVILKQAYDVVEGYEFREDGSFTCGRMGLFVGSSGTGNWTLQNDNQLILNFIFGEKFLKRIFTVENLGTGKIKLTER